MQVCSGAALGQTSRHAGAARRAVAETKRVPELMGEDGAQRDRVRLIWRRLAPSDPGPQPDLRPTDAAFAVVVHRSARQLRLAVGPRPLQDADDDLAAGVDSASARRGPAQAAALGRRSPSRDRRRQRPGPAVGDVRRRLRKDRQWRQRLPVESSQPAPLQLTPAEQQRRRQSERQRQARRGRPASNGDGSVATSLQRGERQGGRPAESGPASAGGADRETTAHGLKVAAARGRRQSPRRQRRDLTVIPTFIISLLGG